MGHFSTIMSIGSCRRMLAVGRPGELKDLVKDPMLRSVAGGPFAVVSAKSAAFSRAAFSGYEACDTGTLTATFDMHQKLHAESVAVCRLGPQVFAWPLWPLDVPSRTSLVRVAHDCGSCLFQPRSDLQTNTSGGRSTS